MDSAVRSSKQGIEMKKQFAVITAAGWTDNESKVHSAHDTAAEAITAARGMKSRWVVRAVALDGFEVGDSVWLDRLGQNPPPFVGVDK
jgi:hypothetical protein